MAMKRRSFLAAAGLSVLSPITVSNAQEYDLLIKGGRVIDPSTGLDAIRDIGISGSYISTVAPTINSQAGETIQAEGRIVCPGLVDIHTHAGRDPNGPALALRDGVTGLVDAGSGGADNMDEVAEILRNGPQKCLALINISRLGCCSEQLTDISNADVALARGAIQRNSDVVVGVKARLSASVTGANDLEALRRSQILADGLPLMIHVGQNYSPLRTLLAMLKQGDIVTHMYAPPPHAILDDNGRLLPEVLAARRRGVLFDFGHGVAGHFDWEMIERATEQGFWPDTISTDWNVRSSESAVKDFPNVISTLLMFNMPLTDAIAKSTSDAARIFPDLSNAGTLNPGAPADITIMELRQGNFEFIDNYGNSRTGSQRLFPEATILRGKQVTSA